MTSLPPPPPPSPRPSLAGPGSHGPGSGGLLETLYIRWNRMLPLAVVLLVLLLSTALAALVWHFILEQQRVRFEREVTAHTQALQQRLADFDELLQATRAFWLAQPGDVTPEEFDLFSQSLGLQSRFPDVLALGYDAWIPRGTEATLETMAMSLGLTDYKVHPATSTQAMRAPIVLVAPLNAGNIAVRGFDMMTSPERRDALLRASQVGQFQVTVPLELQQMDTAGHHFPGFLMMLPIWRPGQPQATASTSSASSTSSTSSTGSASTGTASTGTASTGTASRGTVAAQAASSLQPRQTGGQLAGFIYVAVRADLFLTSLDMAYRAQGISSSTWLAGRPLLSQSALSGAFRADNLLNIGGVQWKLDYAAPNTFGRDFFAVVPFLTLLAGLAVAVLAYRIMLSQVYARERVEAINVRLRESQRRQEQSAAEFEAIFQSMQDAAAFTDQSGRIRMVNRAMNRQFGFRRGELTGQALASLHANRHLDKQQTFQAITTLYQRSNGSQFQGEAQRTEVRDQDGELLGLMEVVRDVTERVQAEQALQAEERRSRDVLDGIPHILWVSSPEGEVTYTNAQHRKRLGDTSLRERLNPHDLGVYDRMWQDAYTLKTRSQCEVRLQVGGGGVPYSGSPRDRWFEIRVAPLLTEEGSASEWVASATDIHDRLLAERLAQRNEERYRGVIEGMPQIVWLTDKRGQATYFNRRWVEYVGHQRGMDGLMAVIHPDDRQEYSRRWSMALEAGRNFEAEHRLLGEDGSYRTFVTRGLPVRDKAGQIIEWVGTSTDVDDSVYAENAARLLADVSSELTARVNDPLAARAAKYQAALNLMMARLAKAGSLWTVPELQLMATANHHENWALPELIDAVMELVAEVARTQERLEVRGHPLLYLVDVTGGVLLPLVGLDGTLRGILGLAYRQEWQDRDHELIGELAQRLASALDNDALRDRAQVAQNELQALNQSLEERVQRRTLELQEANRELEAFSYSVSHDLRTPLRHIVGFGDLLKKETQDTLGSKGTRYLNVMSEAAGRMNTLIDSLLEFSRMGRLPLKASPVPLGPLVASAWRNLEPDRSGRQVFFELGDLPTVEGDATLLDLVFQNLLSNALKYSRTREAAYISVTGEVVDGLATIRVSDNGVGFDSKYKDKLFGVFQRLHRAEEFDGTGIGLANVRRMVTRHGGTVGASSVMGEGATFFITLPVQARAEETL